MQRPTFPDIIRRWPTASDLASDLGMAGKKGTRLVQMWAFRRRIPSERFPQIVRAAEQRGLQGITLQSLYDAMSSLCNGASL